MKDLVFQLRSPMGIVPFVGAGMSQPLGFPGWRDFLTRASEWHSDPPSVLKAIEDGQYEEAATLLWQQDPDAFQRSVRRDFTRSYTDAQLAATAIRLLPMIASGPVITTNFDHVLEDVFRHAGHPFERVVAGPQPDHVIRAMHRNEHVLLKMHGDAEDRTFRTFTGKEYDRNYEALPPLQRILYTNRPLLFLGCSLDRDRTLAVLETIHKEVPGLGHYGIVAASNHVETQRKRRKRLNELGISPLWYPPGEYVWIRELLENLIREASTRLLAEPRVQPSGTTARIIRSLASHDAPVCPGVATPVMERIAQKIVNGEIAFFLGSGVHLGAFPDARRFFDWLAERFDLDRTGLDRAEIAEYVGDRAGRAELWQESRKSLLTDGVMHSVVFDFLARLPGTSLIVTTNYDLLLEEIFFQLGKPFHLLYYQRDGPYEGHFLHRDLSGAIRLIEEPDHVRRFQGEAHVVVKLDGGIAWDERMPESVVITPSDSHAAAGRLPGALPFAVRTELEQRSMLVMGSSLRDPHVQRLVRWAAKHRRAWAIQSDSRGAGWEGFWSESGVDLLFCDLNHFIPALHSAVDRLMPR